MPEDKKTLFIKPTQINVTWPDGTSKSFPLANPMRIGRGEENEVALPDDFQSISRRHIELHREGNTFRLIDLSSKNGVTINGQSVQNALLRDGDEIAIGLSDMGQQVRIGFQLGTESIVTGLAAEAGSTVLAPTNLSDVAPQTIPHLRIRWPSGQVNYFPLQNERVIIGRAVDSDLVIPGGLRFVSNQHAQILKKETGFVVTDLNSTNGTFLNNQRLQPDQYYPLNNEAVIRIGDESIGVSVGLTFIEPSGQHASLDGFLQVSNPTKFAQTKTVLIGRAPECDIVLDSPDVSRNHAAVQLEGNAFIFKDLASRNGSLLNGQPVTEAQLRDSDVIEIGSFLLLFQKGELIPFQSNGMRLDVSGLSKEVGSGGKRRRILDNINLSVLPREFVAVVGGSGAGKSTLLNALIGIRPGSGQVQLNGHNFYREYSHFRSQLGYVPQSDILHTSLTVEKALDYAARLRLPPEMDATERKRRVDAALETVSMNTDAIRRTRVGNLSGGQRKRVSIAAELLADPKLIYLDEATSGLDPGLEKKMMHTLRRMADEGRTVVLVTHATNNIIQTDHVAFISEGRLVYFGPSNESLDFFEVEDFADIYERIEHRGEEWRNVFEEKKPANFQKYVQGRLASARIAPRQALQKVHFGMADFFRQLIVLTQRSLNVLFSDPITLVLMLLLLPIVGTLQLVIGSKDVLTGNLSILADPVAAAKTLVENYTPYAKTNTFVFVMGLEAVLTGIFVCSNDLVRERSIYLRERMVNLKVLPYLLSKAAIYSIFVAIQIALYLLILSLGVKFPEHGLYLPGTLELFVTLFLTMMAGITFGLIISAVSRSTEMAIYLLTMMLFFQFFFAGAIFDLRGNRFEPLSHLSMTRWSLSALGVTIDMPKIVEGTILCSDVPENPLDPDGGTKTVCTNYADAKKDLMINYDTEMLLKSWVVLIGMSLLHLTVTGILLQRTKSE